MKKSGLALNSEKTKGILTSRKQAVENNVLQIDHYTFERRANFTYFGSIVNEDNSITTEIKTRIVKGNRKQ